MHFLCFQSKNSLKHSLKRSQKFPNVHADNFAIASYIFLPYLCTIENKKTFILKVRKYENQF